METLWQTYKDQDVVLLGVNIDEPEGVVEDFVHEFNLTYPVLLGSTLLKNEYNISGRHFSPFPRDYIIGPKGQIVYASAEFDPEAIQDVIRNSLNQAPISDPSPPPIEVNRLDFNGDRTVNFPDFVLFAGKFGSSDPLFDFNGDGEVNFPDFLVFAQNFGRTY